MRPGVLLAFVFAALALLAVALSGAVAWALMRDGVTPQDQRLMLLDAAGLVALLFALTGAWAVLHSRLAQPLKAVTREIETLCHAPTARPLEMPEHHATGGLVDALQDLVAKFIAARAETETAVVEATARSDSYRRRLEAILLNLSEGVIVCNLDHRILLYNQAAARILNGPAALGLGRSLFRIIRPDPVLEALESMRQASGGQPDTACPLPVRLVCEPVETEGSLNAGLATVLSETGIAEGYVLTFTAPHAQDNAMELPPRPEFYDFDLFARKPARELTETPLKELRCVVFDTETTGVRPSQGDEMVAIGAVRIINARLVSGETFERLINPGRPIPAASTRFHGITDEMVTDAAAASEVIREFRAFAGKAALVAHNAAFDMKFLELKEKQASVAFNNPVLDVLLLSAFLHDHTGDHSLAATAKRLGVEITQRHSALGDALTTAKIFLTMLDPLAQRGVTTLGQALAASSRMVKFRKRQARF